MENIQCSRLFARVGISVVAACSLRCDARLDRAAFAVVLFMWWVLFV